jgi:hypothetical protein
MATIEQLVNVWGDCNEGKSYLVLNSGDRGGRRRFCHVTNRHSQNSGTEKERENDGGR